MKGLLHRLAARATGTTVPVHSDARLPFGGLGQRLDDTTDDGDPQQRLAVDDEPATHSSAQSASGTTQSAAPEETQSQPTPQSQPTQQSQPTPQSPSAQSATLVRANAEANSSVAPVSDTLPVNAAVPARLIKDAQRPSVARPASDPASSCRSATAANLRHAANAIGEPSLLMPPAASDRSTVPGNTAPAALRRIATPGAPPHAAVSEAPNEVHVHIGRIEVTAVHEAASPRRRRESAPAMTLDAYLAKRGHT